MKVKVKFLKQIIKEGKLRKVGDTLNINASSAANLASKGVVEVPGYKVEKKIEEVEVNVLQRIN